MTPAHEQAALKTAETGVSQAASAHAGITDATNVVEVGTGAAPVGSAITVDV